MTRTKRGSRQAAFTMIEVMVAVLLTAIATTGIVALYVVNTRASGFSRHTTEATILAQDQMERMRTNGAGSGSNNGIDEAGNSPGMFNVNYAVATAAPAYDDINITVSWVEDGANRAITVLGRRPK